MSQIKSHHFEPLPRRAGIILKIEPACSVMRSISGREEYRDILTRFFSEFARPPRIREAFRAGRQNDEILADKQEKSLFFISCGEI